MNRLLGALVAALQALVSPADAAILLRLASLNDPSPRQSTPEP